MRRLNLMTVMCVVSTVGAVMAFVTEIFSEDTSWRQLTWIAIATVWTWVAWMNDRRAEIWRRRDRRT